MAHSDSNINKRPRRGPLSFFWKLSITALVILSIANIVSVQATNAAKREELAALQAQAENLREEQAELQRLLGITDRSEYLERVAVERYGYSYPGERRFYDMARN